MKLKSPFGIVRLYIANVLKSNSYCMNLSCPSAVHRQNELSVSQTFKYCDSLFKNPNYWDPLDPTIGIE